MPLPLSTSPSSTTSYEEEPVYATMKANDTFHDGNSYAESSASRLLVMGREYGNPLPDKGYIFWGDDNGPLTTYTSPADTLWHIMHRTWTVRSNVPASADSTSVRWNARAVTVPGKASWTPSSRTQVRPKPLPSHRHCPA